MLIIGLPPDLCVGGVSFPAADTSVDADSGGVVKVPSSSADSSAKWVVKHDIIGNPMQMVAVPTHFFKVHVFQSTIGLGWDGRDRTGSPYTPLTCFTRN